MNDIIVMEGLIKRLKSAIDKGNKKEMMKHPEYYKKYYPDKYKEIMGIKAKERQEEIERRRLEEHERYKQDHICPNMNTIKDQIKYDFTPYPNGYFKDRNILIKQIQKDLLKLVIAFTATKEFNDEAKRLLNTYNADLKTLTEEEVEKRYMFAYDADFKPITLSQLKSWYKNIKAYDEGYQTYFTIGDNLEQDMRLCLGIHEDLAQLIALKYINYCKFDSGDGDEGCVYTHIPQKI